MTVRCILFDLDGTLVDSSQLVFAALDVVANAHIGRPWPDSMRSEVFALPLEEQLRRVSPERGDAMYHDFLEYTFSRLNQVRAIAGIEGLLEDLRATTVSLGVVTSRDRDSAQRVLAETRLSKHFDVLVAFEDTDSHKPNPAPLLKALGCLANRPSEAAYVGDNANDMIAAKAAGVMAVRAGWSPYGIDSDSHDQADCTVAHPRDLKAELLLDLQ